MTEVESQDAAFAFFTVGQSDTENSDDGLDKAETVEDSGGRRKLTHVVRDKNGKSPRKTRAKPMLARQDTFVLEADDETTAPILSPRHLGQDEPSVLRAKSSYGIKSILDRAEGISSLSPQVKEYLGAHMRMMGEENSRLMTENNRLRGEMTQEGEGWEKKMKGVNQQLDKERAKNKMLMIRLKENDGDVNGGIIWADDNTGDNKRQTSPSQGSRTASKSSRSRSNSSNSMASITSLMSMSSSINSSNRAGTPAPLVGGEEGKMNLLSKKIRVYR